jgi:hypothetical protein
MYQPGIASPFQNGAARCSGATVELRGSLFVGINAFQIAFRSGSVLFKLP